MGAGITDVKINDVSQTKGTTFFPSNQKVILEVLFAGVYTDDAGIFRNYATGEPTKGKVYSVKFYNGTTLVAHYDMSKGDQLKNDTIKDETGNGYHATLVGGTWVQV